MKSQRHITLIASGICVAMAPFASGQTSAASNQELIDRLLRYDGYGKANYTFKPLAERLRDASGDELEALRAALMAPYAATDNPEVVFRFGMLLSTRPDVNAVTLTIRRLDAATSPQMQRRLCEGLERMLRGLDDTQRHALAGDIVPRMMKVIAKPRQNQLTAEAAAFSLGALGGDGYPALQQILAKPELRRAAAEALPEALASTLDPRAVASLLEFADGEDGRVRQKYVIGALGGLLYTLHKQRTPIPTEAYEAALARIRANLRPEVEPQLLAVSIGAGAEALGVDNDDGLRQFVLASLQHPSEHVRGAALQALFGSKTARLPEVRRAIAAVRQTEADPGAQSTAAAVMDAALAEDE